MEIFNKGFIKIPLCFFHFLDCGKYLKNSKSKTEK